MGNLDIKLLRLQTLLPLNDQPAVLPLLLKVNQKPRAFIVSFAAPASRGGRLQTLCGVVAASGLLEA